MLPDSVKPDSVKPDSVKPDSVKPDSETICRHVNCSLCYTAAVLSCSGSHMTKTLKFRFLSAIAASRRARHGCAIVLPYGGPLGKGGGGDGR